MVMSRHLGISLLSAKHKFFADKTVIMSVIYVNLF
mgnify:CR=1 FL=1